VPRLFALDQNFPVPIVTALDNFIPEAELVPLREIDPMLVEDIEDWQILLALHHHARDWDGLITTDSGILNLPREMAVSPADASHARGCRSRWIRSDQGDRPSVHAPVMDLSRDSA
jgi:hypothetical protein